MLAYFHGKYARVNRNISDGNVLSVQSVSKMLDMGKVPARVYPPLYVADWIDALGADRKAVAKAAGCTVSYISNMAGGRRLNPAAYLLYRMSLFLKITVNDFYEPPPTDKSIEAMRTLSPAARDALINRPRTTN